ncbi:MAG: transporter, family, proline/betaine transporter [Alphaproteobacteria bacterium]|nr:transporter, family, proline/betaine transporter [Alphaproteobacteria bacterium]
MDSTQPLNFAQTRRVVAAGMIGNVLEWYDFAIYGYFATSIGRHFFPHEDPVAQLLSAFGVFAIGYLMRPVGGALIGHIGDRWGRRAALTVSVTAMAVPTFLIGLLPGYASLGLLAPVALTLLRMVQGLSVGGEYTSSMVFLVEHAPPGRRGLMGALASCGACGGILLGSAVGAGFAATLSTEALDAWGWRVPFLLGLVVGIAGYFLRRHVQETAPATRRQRAPIIETLHDHWRIVLGMAGLSVFNAVGFYVGFVYLVSWLQVADGIPPARALEINSISMVALLPVMIVTGLLTDRFGRKPFLLLATVLGFVGAMPVFWLLNHPSALLAQLGQLGLVLMIGIYCGTQPTIMVEAAPAQVRCTAVALGYNICLGIIGGLTPLVATWLVERTGDETAPAFLVMAAAAITFITILQFRETYRTAFVGGSSGPTPALA